MTDKWTDKKVIEHFEEAITTLKRLPSVKVRGYFNLWPEVIHTKNELMFQKALHSPLRATPDAISRLEETFEWMQWITVEERKLIWKRAAHMRWKAIAYEFGYDRSTAWRKWVIACTKIATRLNAKDK